MNAAETDRKLVRDMLGGRQQAFDEFYNAYMPRLYRFVLKRVAGDPQIAEEVCQEVLSRAVQSIQKYRGEASLFTWLCQIARNGVTDHWRKRQRREQLEIFPEDDPAIAAALESLDSGNQAGLEVEQSRAELLQLVEVALDRLPSMYGNVLEWKYIDGLSVAEIAQRTGQGPVAIQSLLGRARAAFRDAFTTLSGDDWTEAVGREAR